MAGKLWLNSHTFTHGGELLERVVLGLASRYRNLKQVQEKIVPVPSFCQACWTKGMCSVEVEPY